VGFPHEVKGTGICAFVRLAADHEGHDPEEVVGSLKEQVRQVIGPIATPDRIEICHRLPKTRAGKIQRTILSRIALGEFEDLGDISGLDDPMVVERLVEDIRRQREQVAE
jgi:acetyl-CoA synthetase